MHQSMTGKCEAAIRFALTLLVLFLVVVLTDIRRAVAALQPAESRGTVSSWLMPRSPLVERLQVLFAELKIYGGVIDGRLNDDLTAAVEHYQSRAGLTVSGKVSEELLAHVEFKSEAEALLVRLDTVGSEQRIKAREKLQSVALTRSLLDPTRKNQTADPARNSDFCFQAPTVDCLISEAIESAKAVGRPHFRDWTYGEIAIVQARLGQVDAARKTAGRVQDPRLILVTLRNIAVALADANRVDLAMDSAAIIPDGWLKAEALVSLAVAQTRNGGWPEARETMREISVFAMGPSSEKNVEFKRTSLTSSLAQQLADAGDPTVARRLMNAERTRLKTLFRQTEGSGYSASLSTLAAAFANMDQPDEARSLLDYNVDIVHQRSVSVALARAYGRAGQDKSATAIINALEEPRYRSVLLADMARFQAGFERQDAARQNMQRAEVAVDAIAPDHKFAINHAHERIAGAWIALGDFKKATEVAARITDAGIRTGIWWNISMAYRDAGMNIQAVKSAKEARSSMAKVNSALDRVWLYCNQVQVLAGRKDDQQASATFAKALKVVHGIRHSWTRAQALVRLVRAFAVLPGPLSTLKPSERPN